jgi:PBP1b-binding outer membrane lipoprotein LpoB
MISLFHYRTLCSVLLATVLLAGCQSTEEQSAKPAPRPQPQPVKQQPAPTHDINAATIPFRGRWTTALSATLAANPGVESSLKMKMAADMMSHPISLLINDTSYISTTNIKTLTEYYQVVRTSQGKVVISFLPDLQRTAILELKAGQLHLTNSTGLITVVFDREQ